MSKIQSITINAFMHKIIDYAGLFPPAKLPLNIAFDNYLIYKGTFYNEFLSRFICPAALLPELERIIKSYEGNCNEISLSVLARSSDKTDDFYLNFKEDLIYWSEFLKSFENSVLTETLELKIPDEIILEGNSEKISDLIKYVSMEIRNALGHNVFIFFECITGKNLKSNIKNVIKSISIHNISENNCGFKLRTGGVTIDSFPESETIAYSIKECLDNSVPMKCTAGLHHPFRHFDKEIGVMMHGFINVFGAGIISMRHNISHYEIVKMLNDENPMNFKFYNDLFEWNGYKVDIDEIKEARNKLMISFGSCSFDDPVTDLKKLNLI